MHFPKLRAVHSMYECVCVYGGCERKCKLQFQVHRSELDKNENINYSTAKQLCKHNNCMKSFIPFLYALIHSIPNLIQLKRISNVFGLLVCRMAYNGFCTLCTRLHICNLYNIYIYYRSSAYLKRDSICVHFVLCAVSSERDGRKTNSQHVFLRNNLNILYLFFVVCRRSITCKNHTPRLLLSRSSSFSSSSEIHCFELLDFVYPQRKSIRIMRKNKNILLNGMKWN